MSPEAWRSLGTYFSFDEHQIFYRDEGSGPALLLLHGFPSASWDWHRIWQPLTAHFRVIAADMLGFGFSDKPRPYRYSIKQQADLHEQLLKHLDIQEAHLFSHDYGVSVVQEMLARELDNDLSFRPLSSCFLNGGLFINTYRPRPIQKLLMSPIGPLMSPFLGRRNLAKTFRDIFGPQTQPSEEEIDQFWALIDFHNGKWVIPRVIRYMKERSEYRDRWGGRMPDSKVPMRLINGNADPISGIHVAQFYEGYIPHADVVHLSDIGHYPQVEAPEEVLHHFLDFVRKVG